MRIRETLSKALLIALAFVLIPTTAVSAQKITPGSTCKVLNQKIVYQSKSYTCTKSGKKLTWNKGVAIKNPTPNPTPKIEIVPAMPTSFADLEERYKGCLLYTSPSPRD